MPPLGRDNMARPLLANPRGIGRCLLCVMRSGCPGEVRTPCSFVAACFCSLSERWVLRRRQAIERRDTQSGRAALDLGRSLPNSEQLPLGKYPRVGFKDRMCQCAPRGREDTHTQLFRRRCRRRCSHCVLGALAGWLKVGASPSVRLVPARAAQRARSQLSPWDRRLACRRPCAPEIASPQLALGCCASSSPPAFSCASGRREERRRAGANRAGSSRRGRKGRRGRSRRRSPGGGRLSRPSAPERRRQGPAELVLLHRVDDGVHDLIGLDALAAPSLCVTCCAVRRARTGRSTSRCYCQPLFLGGAEVSATAGCSARAAVAVRHRPKELGEQPTHEGARVPAQPDERVPGHP